MRFFFLQAITLVALIGSSAFGQSVKIDFENYSTGSIHYQGPGTAQVNAQGYTLPVPYGSLWTIADEWGTSMGNWDQGVVDLGGNKVFRVSNRTTSGEFSNQINSVSLPLPSGESGAALWNDRGLYHYAPTARQPRAYAVDNFFTYGFKFKSATGGPQANLRMNFSANARCSDKRQTFHLIEDTGAGYRIDTGSLESNGSLTLATVASGLSYDEWHTLEVLVIFNDGLNEDGTSNDTVLTFVDDVLVHTGRSWEAYFAAFTPTNTPQAVDTVMFRLSGTAAGTNAGNGFYFDDMYLSGAGDEDEDGLSDAEEMYIGTDPLVADTDEDGLEDGVEVNESATNPLDPDTDDDGLKDGVEVNEYSTDPTKSDTDGDGFDDRFEVETETNPLDINDPVAGGAGSLATFASQLASEISTIELDLFTGPNANADKGRRTSLSNRLSSASKSIAKGDYDSAWEACESARLKVDGVVEGEPDWIYDGPEKVDLYESIVLLQELIEYLGQ